MELRDLLKGNILIGSRAVGMAKTTSDWDIVCTSEFIEWLFYESKAEVFSHINYPNGYEACAKIMSDEQFDNFDEEFEDSDQGGFGSDLVAIHEFIFDNGLKVNFFEYPSKKKWKAYKKLNKEMLKLKQESFNENSEYDRDVWVQDFIECQYAFGINKRLN